jgi:hypothetical protein
MFPSRCPHITDGRNNMTEERVQVFVQTKRQIQKNYNDALAKIVKDNRQYFQTVKDVQSGKIPPPAGIKTEAQKEAWKRGYLNRYVKKTDVISNMAEEMQNAGLKTRKNVENAMNKLFGLNNKVAIDTMNAKNVLTPKTTTQIKTILDKNLSIFDKGALKSLENATLANKRLRREMANSIIAGDDDKKMIQRIKKITGMAERDAKRVLVTERTRVEGMSQQLTAAEYHKKTGVKPKKRWICTFHNSRDSHKDVHNTVVEYDDVFANGLEYPGDPAGSAEETINCGCRMEVFVDG